ncbi:hypothetical protein F511_45502 [Dorcoceras hygrometricum]|uniref:Uncharacterized protein n=1 Tax=Dorcoceras hygrometricum TaxID=472368 RepID=A0A2Z6ZWZ9_9LAMI|nr:hypothetical protein F511_45502 [Dorcoceras hygrometricum]
MAGGRLLLMRRWLGYWLRDVGDAWCRLVDACCTLVARRCERRPRACLGRVRPCGARNFVRGGAARRPPLRRIFGDVVTAGLISSRVWFGPVPGSP